MYLHYLGKCPNPGYLHCLCMIYHGDVVHAWGCALVRGNVWATCGRIGLPINEQMFDTSNCISALLCILVQPLCLRLLLPFGMAHSHHWS